MNDTNKCVADCPKGNGTASDNQEYSECVNGCIGKFYFTSTGTPSQPTGAAGGSGSGSASGSASPTGTDGQTASSTSGAAASSTSNAGGEVIRVAGSTAGFLGFLAAVLAL